MYGFLGYLSTNLKVNIYIFVTGVSVGGLLEAFSGAECFGEVKARFGA